MKSSRWQAFTCALAFSLLLPFPASARRKIVSTDASPFGQFTSPTTGQIAKTSLSPMHGVSVTAYTYCPPSQGAPTGGLCPADYLFLYQVVPIPSSTAPNNMVLTFSDLAGFAFDTSAPSFGVLLCGSSFGDPNACTALSDISSLNLGFDAIGGNLIVTLPDMSAVPANANLTFFIRERFSNSTIALITQPLVPPLLSINGAVVSPPRVSFGSQEGGTTSDPQTITVYNSPDFGDPNPSPTLNISSITASAGFSATGDCAANSSIASGAACAFVAAFMPPASGNSSPPTTGTFTVADNSPPANEVATLTGTASSPGITIEPSVLFFGSQVLLSQSATQAVKITNSTTNAFALNLSVTPNLYTNTTDFTEQDNCGASLAAGANCQVNVSFTPNFPGSVSATLQLHNSDTTHVIVLNGTANDPNTATVSPVVLNFSGQNVGSTSNAQTVTITNANAQPTPPARKLNIIAVNPTAEFAVSNNTCTALTGTGQANDNCTISVTFNPTLAGPITGTLTVANDSVNGNGTLVVPLSGTGMNFGMSATTTSVSVAAGGTATYNLSLVPQGGYSGTVQIACTGSPSEANCTPNPASPSLNGKDSVAVTVTVTTTAPSTVLPLWRGRPPLGWPLLLAVLTCCALLFLDFEFAKRNKRGYAFVPLGALATVLFLCTSCGGGSTPGPINHDPGTPKQPATLTVTATSGSLQPVVIKLTLNVT